MFVVASKRFLHRGGFSRLSASTVFSEKPSQPSLNSRLRTLGKGMSELPMSSEEVNAT